MAERRDDFVGAAGAVAEPELVRLLRAVGRGPARLSREAELVAIGNGEERPRRCFASAVLDAAVSAGLARLQGDEIHVAPAAASFLRRAMTKDRDEIFQEQHRDCETVSVRVQGVAQSARRNTLSVPLLALARLKDRHGEPFFPPQALEAGERLAVDFHRGQLQPRITASFEPRLSSRGKGEAGSTIDLSDAAMAARVRFSRAAEAMGPELAGVAIDLCCFEKGLETVERERQWPARSAKLLLRAALLSLARHYAPPAPGRPRRNSHHWGTADFRPDMKSRRG